MEEKIKVSYEQIEKARRKNAGAIGGLKAKINELKLDLERDELIMNTLIQEIEKFLDDGCLEEEDYVEEIYYILNQLKELLEGDTK